MFAYKSFDVNKVMLVVVDENDTVSPSQSLIRLDRKLRPLLTDFQGREI